MSHLKRALVRAPSNIALIKYMGKIDAAVNLPANSSLSMTLDSLATWVSIECLPAAGASTVQFEAIVPEGTPSQARAPQLSEKGRAKVTQHVKRTQEALPGVLRACGLSALGVRDAKQSLCLRSANTFPEASGIASSASSFAAITLATALACVEDVAGFQRALEASPALRRELAKISRQGSGSSCRSFEGPYVLWSGEAAQAVEASMPELAHFVILISSAAKEVSSSEAHLRVKTSPLWQGRVERVEHRLSLVRQALLAGDFAALARLTWSEAWEMHSLFHTASEPFSYWKGGTIDALQWLAPFVEGTQQASSVPPIVTLDAGPNVHITVPMADVSTWRARLTERFGVGAILEDRPGRGAVVVRVEGATP